MQDNLMYLPTFLPPLVRIYKRTNAGQLDVPTHVLCDEIDSLGSKYIW